MNCVAYLVNFGANVWLLDNDYHLAMDIAALEDREDIVKFLDEAQSAQMRKSPKITQELKEKAMRLAEKNAKHYEEVQDRASRRLAKERRRNELLEAQRNGDFKAPSDGSVFKKLTLKLKGTKKLKAVNGGNTPQFSDLVQGNRRKSAKQNITGARNSNEIDNLNDFKVSEMDDSGKRTLKSVRGTLQRKDGQVLYVRDDFDVDPTARPPLTNVFPGTSMNSKNWNNSKSDSNPVDSGNDSFDDSGNIDDEHTPSLFNRPQFGDIAFMSRFNPIESFKSDPKPAFDDIDSVLHNGELAEDEDESLVGQRLSGLSIGSGSSSTGDRSQELPWKEDDVETLDDDEQETEYTKIMMFLESCGLTRYTHLFTNSEVDMDALMELTQDDFTEIGLPIGPRRKLVNAIERRKQVLNQKSVITDTHL